VWPGILSRAEHGGEGAPSPGQAQVMGGHRYDSCHCKGNVCPQPLHAAGGCRADVAQGQISLIDAAKQKWKIVFPGLQNERANNPQILVFPCSKKNVNLLKQNPNFFSKVKKKKEIRKLKAAQTAHLWRSPASLKPSSSAALGEAQSPTRPFPRGWGCWRAAARPLGAPAARAAVSGCWPPATLPSAYGGRCIRGCGLR